MARKPPPKEHQFKPGVSGNPEGGRKQNPQFRALKKMATSELVEIGEFILSQNVIGLKAIIKDAQTNPSSETSGLKAWIAMVAMRGIAKGDVQALDVLLNRLVGKVKDNVIMSGSVSGAYRVNINLPSNKREPNK